MGYKEVIRKDDIDSAGDKMQNTQPVLQIDEAGNLRSTGDMAFGEGGVAGDLPIPDGTSTVGGSTSLSGGSVVAGGGGGTVVVNSSGGDVNHSNSAGGTVLVNTGGSTPVFVNSPQGSAVDCEEELVKSEADAAGAQTDQSAGYPTDGDQSELGGSNRATYEDGGCAGDYMNPASGEFEGQDKNAEANKITNYSLPVSEEGTISEQMELGPGNDENPDAEGVTWQMDNGPDGVSIDRETGQITGNVPESGGTATVTAYDGEGTILDTKQYSLERSDGVYEMVNPAPGYNRISSGFSGSRVHPVYGGRRAHNGTDFAAVSGSPVVAAMPGKVIFSGPAGGAGNLVKIEHYDENNRPFAVTKYMHLKNGATTVSAGDTVGSGDQISQVGSTGASTGPHLHFGLQINGKYVDPEYALNGNLQVAAKGGGPGTGTRSVNRNGLKVGPNTGAGCGSSAPPAGCGGAASGAGGSLGDPTAGASASQEEVIKRMNAVMDQHPELDQQDRDYLLFAARIESNYNPNAKNPNSSATGLFQMIDSTAGAYPHDRTNIEGSTEAMINFYNKEQLRYYNNFQNSGGTSLGGGITVNPNVRSTYKSYSKTEFIYGLIHHDGVGNAQKGKNKGGVAYAQRRMREFNQ